MQDNPGYTPAERLGAALGLLAIGLVAFILADVATGGRLTGSRPCTDCGPDGEEM